MRLNHKLVLLFSTLLLNSAVMIGQDTGLPDENVNIVKDFDARLLETNKIPVTPTLPLLDTSTRQLDYVVPPKPAVVNYEPPTLRPIGMRSTGKEDAYNGYLKAGAGVPTSFYGEAGYYLKPSDKFDAKLWARHHSANAKSLENQKFFNNDFLAKSNIYLDNSMVIEGQAGYSYDRIHYYGYDHDSLEFDAEGVRQDFKILDLGVRLFNSERNDMDINYFADVSFSSMNDYFSNRETGFKVDLGGTKWFNDKHPLRVVISTDLTRFEDTTIQRLNNIYVQPSFTFHADFFNVRIGGNFASNRDIFYVFPDAELALRIWGDGFQVFGGAGGDLRKNTYRSMAAYNPFLQIRESELTNTQYREYYAGLKGDLGWLEYSGRITYANARDLALYQPFYSATGITRFATVYDTLDIFNLQGSIKLRPMEGLTVGGTFSSNVFDTFNEEKAWGLPHIEGNFHAIYSLLNGKAQLKGNLYVADQIAYLSREGTAEKTNALLDLSFGGSFYFTKNIGVFLDINNLLNNRRERWHDYPMFGMNILGGVTARF